MIPKPFKRPSVTLGGLSASRRWADVPVSVLMMGDIVQDMGLVTLTELRDDKVVVQFFSGAVLLSEPAHVLRAFTEGPSVGHSE